MEHDLPILGGTCLVVFNHRSGDLCGITILIYRGGVMNKVYTDVLNECRSCDFVADFYSNQEGECVCPQCNSTDYYILDEGGNDE